MKWIAAHPYGFSLALLAVLLAASVAVGSVFIPPTVMGALFQARLGGQPLTAALQPMDTILFTLRLPRAVLALLTGAALAGSGAAYQGLFRNPLADPYLIGVASGAGLGAVAAMSVRWPYTFWGLMVIPLAAFAGALVTVAVVLFLAKVQNSLPASNLILAGVAVSSFATALTSFWMLRSTGEVRRALVWLMGGATQSGWQPVAAVLP